MKQIIYFIAATILTGILFFIIGIILLFGTFSLAGETLKEHENIDALYFYLTLFVLVISTIIAIRFWRIERKAVASGITLSVIIAFPVLIYFAVIYIDNFFYYEQFDTNMWMTETHKPLLMATTLTKNEDLIGFTRKEVKDMLGEAKEENYSEETKKGSIIYITKSVSSDRWQEGRNSGAWELTIYFQDEKVVASELFQGGFDY